MVKLPGRRWGIFCNVRVDVCTLQAKYFNVERFGDKTIVKFLFIKRSTENKGNYFCKEQNKERFWLFFFVLNK